MKNKKEHLAKTQADNYQAAHYRRLAELAELATYVGSPEHKARRWWGGLPEGDNFQVDGLAAAANRPRRSARCTGDLTKYLPPSGCATLFAQAVSILSSRPDVSQDDLVRG